MSHRRGVVVGISLAVLLPLCREGRSFAATKVHLLVVGNNQTLVSKADDGSDAFVQVGEPLRFADDDAAAFYDFLRPVATDGHLLTVMDNETAAAFPGLVSVARPPTTAELKTAVAALAGRLGEERLRGEQTVVYVFFSGHGSVLARDEPALVMLDGGIGHRFLYEEILDKLPADYVHLFVDACHAEAIVRPRDVETQGATLSTSQANAFVARMTLARYPQVGAIVAASVDAEAHEWDVLGHGVFTYELLSALRGGADVNRDGKIEYSEIYAFLGAANRGVPDPRARLAVVAHPPDRDRHAPILDLSRFPSTGAVHLRNVHARAALIEVEDANGRRLASLRSEPDFVADLLISEGTTYVRVGGREARFEARSGDTITFDRLLFRDPRARSRGALEDAVRRGLFASQFGRGYYLGFIDQAPDFASVTFPAEGVQTGPPVPAVGRTDIAGARELAAGVGVSNAIAYPFSVSGALRVGLQSRTAKWPDLVLDVARASQADLSETRVVGRIGWLLPARLDGIRGWVGLRTGGGFIVQAIGGQPSRWSPLLSVGPVLGGGVEVTRRLSFWLDGDLAAMAYRRDGHYAVALVPSGFGGVSLDF